MTREALPPWQLAELSHDIFAVAASGSEHRETVQSSSSDLLQAALGVLGSWSAARWIRKTPLALVDSEPDAKVKLWCAHIYKRGLENLTWNGRHLACVQLSASRAAEDLVMNPEFVTSPEVLKTITFDLNKGNTLCILDAGFAALWPEFQALGHRPENIIVYRPSESTKRLETIAAWAYHMKPGIRTVWSVGGGITSDLGGFFAGLFGLEHKSCPTTLLSAYDASLGGKTGANLPPWGKNQVGLFYPTTRWLIAPEHFTTLAKDDVLGALAEGLKHVWLAGDHGSAEFERLERFLDDLAVSPATPTLAHATVISSVVFEHRVKAALVRADPLERGLRAALNLGHTIAHVLEALADEGWIAPISHGIAVAVGMKCLLAFGWIHDDTGTFEAVIGKLLRASRCELPLRVIGEIRQPRLHETAAPKEPTHDHSVAAAQEDLFWSRFSQLAAADKKQGLQEPGQGFATASKETSSDHDVLGSEVNFVLPRRGFAGHLLASTPAQTSALQLDSLFTKVPMSELIKQCKRLPLVTF